MGQLVWIASYPKSGNTWMRAFLHNYIRQPDAPYDINRLTDLAASDVNAERYQRYDQRPASQYSVADVQRMRRLVHRDLTTLDATLVFVKTHNARLVVAGAPLRDDILKCALKPVDLKDYNQPLTPEQVVDAIVHAMRRA